MLQMLLVETWKRSFFDVPFLFFTFSYLSSLEGLKLCGNENACRNLKKVFLHESICVSL